MNLVFPGGAYVKFDDRFKRSSYLQIYYKSYVHKKKCPEAEFVLERNIIGFRFIPNLEFDILQHNWILNS